MNLKKLLLFVLFFTFTVSPLYSFNRWFKVSPGFRIAGLVNKIDSRAPKNGTSIGIDFGVGLNLDIQMEKRLGVDIDILYLRKGSDVSNSIARDITLEYISIPMLLKIYFIRKKAAFVVGPVHNFLVGASGTLNDPNVQLNTSNINSYDLGIAFGFSYVMADFGDMRLVGDFRMELGLLNAYKGWRPELYNRTMPYLGIGLNF